jgi:GTPase SAR1 family protein
MANIELKVVLLGKECCGKTSLAERFLNDRFAGENRYQNTIGAAFGAKVGTQLFFFKRLLYR